MNIVNYTLSRDLAFLRHHSGFDVFLYDSNGILLSFLISNKKVKYFNNQMTDYTGHDFSKKTIGTSSHSMCMILDEPFLIIPTENYNKTIQHVSTAISVPIHNFNGEVIAALTFVYSEANDLYLTNRSMLSGMISFQLSLVNKIEHKLKRMNRVPLQQTKKMFACFDTASLLTNDSLIAINKNGEIENLNSNAEKLFGLTEEQCKGKSLKEAFGKDATILVNILKRKSYLSKFSTCSIVTLNKEKYSLRVIPCEMVDGALICLRPYKTSAIPNLKSNNINALFTFSDILGESSEIKHTKQLAKKFAATPFNILLLGDSGTGKELFAHAIHHASRPEGPFITINCAAMPKELIESELFGYEGGSFTGADPKGRKGKLEMANGGTLFLDEIGDMPMDLQPILLRCIETKLVMRIGGNRYIPSDFRVIAATNKNIQDLIAQNRFREDLYFRLSSLRLFIPSLKNRGTDILLLARHFIRKICDKYHLPIYEIDPSVEKVLMAYDWPGNIRELQNVINTAMSLAENEVITVTDLSHEIVNHSQKSIKTSEIKTLKEIEKQAIRDALDFTNNNVKKAAELLGISRTTLYEKIKKYNDK